MKNLSKYLSAPEPFVERTLARYTESEDGCWLYSGSTTQDGYAQANYKLDGQQYSVYPHVLAYLRTHASIADGDQVDHGCHDPLACVEPCMHRRCINPRHLEAMPGVDNNRRSGSPPAMNARKSRCPQGHEYDKTGWAGERRCSECQREKSWRQYQVRGPKDNAKRAEKMRLDPEYREKRLAAQRARSSSEEGKARRRERYASDPEYRELVKARAAERYRRMKQGGDQ